MEDYEVVLEPRGDSQHVKPRDTNSRIAEMIAQIIRNGPEINEISKRIGVFKETVRYWYKALLQKGFTVHALINHEALGLRRVLAVVEFAGSYKPYAEAIMTSMSELCYVVGFMKTIPDDSYVLQASVPGEHIDSWIEFMAALKDGGLFRSIDILTFDWVRVAPMRAELYDFKAGIWQFDWSTPPKIDPRLMERESSERQKFDCIDLRIIEQLQYDANKTFTEIQENLKVNYKTLTWHYRTHVLGRGLVKNHVVSWVGTKYDHKLEKAMHRKHRYMWIELLAKDLSENERIELMAKVNQLPFLWGEAGGRNYYAQFAFPIENIFEAMEFIRDAIFPIRERVRWFLMDQTHALRFTVTPKLFDEQSKRWRFEQADLLHRFEKLFLEINERGN